MQHSDMQKIVVFLGTVSLVCAACLQADELGLKLFHMAGETNKGFVTAPAPMGDLLGTLYFAADAETETDFKTILFSENTREDVRDKRAALEQEPGGYLSAGGVWVSPSHPLLPAYREEIVRTWKLHPLPMPDPKDIPASVRAINQWLGERIPLREDEGLSPDDFDANTRVIGASVAEFRGKWVHFKREHTAWEPFYHNEKEKSRVAMMKGLLDIRHAEMQHFHAVELVYDRSGLATWILVPKNARQFTESMASLTPDGWTELREAFQERSIELWLPRMRSYSRIDWKDPLVKAGLQRPFEPGDANFSRMHGDHPEPLFLGTLGQITRIEWDEVGTVARASTYYGAPFGEPPPTPTPRPPLRVIANHPFAFFIVEPQTGKIYFAGIVSEASQLQLAPDAAP
jgi:serine protease inhibitor